MTCSGCSSRSAGSSYPVWQYLSFIHGDAFVFSVRLAFSGTPYMLQSGDRVYLAMRSDDGTVVINKEYLYVNQSSNGYVSFSLLPSDTDKLSPGLYTFEIEFRLKGGSAVVTAVKGIAEVRQDLITQEVRDESDVF